MKEKNDSSPGCGILLILLIISILWFLPRFISTGGDLNAGFESVKSNMIWLFGFGIAAFLIYIFFADFRK